MKKIIGLILLTAFVIGLGVTQTTPEQAAWEVVPDPKSIVKTY